MTGFNILIIMLMSAIPLIDWACHLFGLISGLLLGMWYFGAALAGPPFAHDAPSLIAAQRAALANARALAGGGGSLAALPPIPGARVASPAPGQPQGHWQGMGRTTSGGGAGSSQRDSGAPSGAPSGALTLAMDSTQDCLCHPMTAINMACSAGAPPGLSRGALLSLGGLLGYFVLLAVGFGLLYGGYLPAPPPLAGTLAGDSIYVPCLTLKLSFFRTDANFKCPPPYDNLAPLAS
jgi:hypothetical protein